jgi:hypothetical protein
VPDVFEIRACTLEIGVNSPDRHVGSYRFRRVADDKDVKGSCTLKRVPREIMCTIRASICKFVCVFQSVFGENLGNETLH